MKNSPASSTPPAAPGAEEQTAEEHVARLWEAHWSGHSVDDVHEIRTRFATEAFRALTPHLDTPQGAVLEIACGTGRLVALTALAHAHTTVVGMDISPSSLRLASRLKSALGLANCSLTRGNLFALPYADGAFDVVFSEGVIQHFKPNGNPSRLDALSEMTRVLRPGGRLVVGVVNWHCYPHTLYKFILKRTGRGYQYGYEQSFSTKDLRALLQSYGLHVVKASGYYPAHALLRLRPYSKLLAQIGRLVDRIQAKWFVDRFGFEIWVSAIKPTSEDRR